MKAGFPAKEYQTQYFLSIVELLHFGENVF